MPRNRILFIGHDASRTGAPMVLLHLLRWLRDDGIYDFDVLLRAGGDLLPEYEALGETCVVETLTTRGRGPIQKIASRFRGRHAEDDEVARYYAGRNVGLVYSNTMTNGSLLERLAPLDCPTICHVHELDHWIDTRRGMETLGATKRYANHYIAASYAVRDCLQLRHNVVEEAISVIHEFVPTDELATTTDSAGKEFGESHGIPRTAFVVGGCGTIDWRKGPDLFVQVAATVTKTKLGRKCHFVWAGGKQDAVEYSQIMYDVHKTGLCDIVHFVGEMPNPGPLFARMDVLALTSREDPFPLVMLEAASKGKPIVCFDGSGGSVEFVGREHGGVVPYLDVEKMANAILEYMVKPDVYKACGDRLSEVVTSQHDVKASAPKVVSIIEKLMKASNHKRMTAANPRT
jgi:glycosyltransferase involved in cell wall biosynthesis